MAVEREVGEEGDRDVDEEEEDGDSEEVEREVSLYQLFKLFFRILG